MTLSLPTEKIQKLRSDLEFFKNKYRATKRQIQKLWLFGSCRKGNIWWSNFLLENNRVTQGIAGKKCKNCSFK